MSWWGKLIGGTFGFMLGGPMGAILGASFGHKFDRGRNTQGDAGPVNVEKIQSAFFTATFSMMGYIAKSDGRVTQHEISVARDVMQQMHLNAQQKKVAMKLFGQGKQSGFPAEDILQQFKQECHRRRNLMQMFLEILILTALADGGLHKAENSILRNAAQVLGFSAREYQNILARMRAQSHFHSVDNTTMGLNDAYKLLGITRNASEAEVKKAYRRQMNQHHPDKLVSKGLPQEMMDIANQKTLDIKTAYELLRKFHKS